MFLPPLPPPLTGTSSVFYVNKHEYETTTTGTYKCRICGVVDVFGNIAGGTTTICPGAIGQQGVVIPAGGFTGGFTNCKFDEDLFLFGDAPTKDLEKPTCPDCNVELCKELDAYYGKNEYWAQWCSKCRRKRGIR